MNIEDLGKFLFESNMAGYAGGDEKQWIKREDGATMIPFKSGPWRSEDVFYGGEPYGGGVTVFYDGKAEWMMVYYGWVVNGEEPDPIYAILREALSHMPEEAPFRGPEEYKSGDLTYTNSWKGDVERYSGQEKIYREEKIVYEANYMGGLVDQRKGV